LGLSVDGDSDEPGILTPADSMVQVVFGHVLKDPKPPERLQKLVVETLAEYLEPGLLAHLEHMITLPIAYQVIRSMLLRRQIKSEEPEVKMEGIAKLENNVFPEDQPLSAPMELVRNSEAGEG
jgi:hypothetical protein